MRQVCASTLAVTLIPGWTRRCARSKYMCPSYRYRSFFNIIRFSNTEFGKLHADRIENRIIWTIIDRTGNNFRTSSLGNVETIHTMACYVRSPCPITRSRHILHTRISFPQIISLRTGTAIHHNIIKGLLFDPADRPSRVLLFTQSPTTREILTPW